MRLKDEVRASYWKSSFQQGIYYEDYLLDSHVEEHSLEIFVLETFVVFWNETTTSDLILESIEWKHSLVLLDEISLTFGYFHCDVGTSIWVLILNSIEKRYSYKFAWLTISTFCLALLRCCLVTFCSLLTKPSVPYKFQRSEPHIIPYGRKSGCLLRFLVVSIASGQLFGGT